MTQVGHTLTGLALGVVGLPTPTSRRWQFAYVAAFVLLPNIPDLPLPLWGHERYDISHSVFVNSAIIILLVSLLFWRKSISTVGGWRVIICAALAWLSHMLLDSFYNHGHGLGIFWPISDAHLALPLPWFAVMYAPPFPLTAQNLRIFAIEFVGYSPLVLLAGWWKTHFKPT